MVNKRWSLVPFLLALGVAAPATAAPVDLTDPSYNSANAQIVIDGEGVTTVAWGREAPGGLYIGGLSTRTPAGPAFSAPLDLLPNPPARISNARRLAVGADGTVAIATVNNNIRPAVLQVRVRRPGQPLGEWIDASPAGEQAEAIDIAVTAQGDVVAVWELDTTTNRTVQSATLPAGATTFGPVQVLSIPTTLDIESLDVASNARGDVWAVWTRQNQMPVFNRVQAAVRPAGASAFELRQDVSGALGSAYRPSAAVDPAGGVVIAWEQLGIFGAVSSLQTSSRAAGSTTFSDVETLTGAGVSISNPKAAVDPQGRATLVWSLAVPVNIVNGQPVTVPDKVQVATREPGESFGAPVDLSDPTASANGPTIAVNDRGDVAVAWERRLERIWIALRSAGAAGFSAAQPIDPDRKGRFPALAVAPDGDMTVVWTGYDDDGGIIRSDDLDTTAPLVDLTLPPTAAAGTPVTLSAQVRDRLSAIASVTWDLGDGATATGADITHTFTALGTKRLTVTVTDAAGNSAQATGTLEVVPAPAPGAGGGAPGTDPAAAAPAAAAGATIPRLLSAKLVRRSFRPALSGGPIGTRLARTRGTALELTTSAAGRLELTVLRQRQGRPTAKGRCVTGRRTGRRCVVLRTVATLGAPVPEGRERLVLTGRAGGKALPAGRYRLRLRLVAGGTPSAPTTLPMTIMR